MSGSLSGIGNPRDVPLSSPFQTGQSAPVRSGDDKLPAQTREKVPAQNLSKLALSGNPAEGQKRGSLVDIVV